MINILERVRRLLEEGEYFEEPERKYRTEQVLKTGKRAEAERSLSETTNKNLELMKKIANRASGMRYYEETIASDRRIKEIKEFGGKVIGTFCNFVPEELIYAAGAIPIRLCSGFYDAVNLAEEVLPRDICPLIKSSFGLKMLALGYFEVCDLVIMPTTCDGKKKLGDILSSYLPVWTLQVPPTKDNPKSKEFWLADVRMLKKKIERLTKVKITKHRLREAIELLHRRQEVFRRFYEIRKSKPPVITGRDALLVAQTSFYDEIIRWIQKTEELCRELEEKIKSGTFICDHAPRLLLIGSPIIWPNWKILNIIEEEAIIVIDELCSGTQRLYDPVEVDEQTMEGMLRAIAERYLLPSICPCFIKSDDRIDRILQMIDDFKVDGVVYHTLRLCILYDMESSKIKEVLRDKGIPMLEIITDYSQEDVEQIRTRVEAFLEMVKAKTK